MGIYFLGAFSEPGAKEIEQIMRQLQKAVLRVGTLIVQIPSASVGKRHQKQLHAQALQWQCMSDVNEQERVSQSNSRLVNLTALASTSEQDLKLKYC